MSLGNSPLTGKQAIDQVRQFRHQLCLLHKKLDLVTLVTVEDVEDLEDVETRCRGVAAFYDADDPCAVEWVKRAEAVSAELWQSLAARRKCAVRE